MQLKHILWQKLCLPRGYNKSVKYSNINIFYLGPKKCHLTYKIVYGFTDRIYYGNT